MLFSISIFAHSGRTDSHGGHNDRINGGYHYHHGHGAHQHKDGVCPYKTLANHSNEKDNSSPFGKLILAAAGIYAFSNREKILG